MQDDVIKEDPEGEEEQVEEEPIVIKQEEEQQEVPLEAEDVQNPEMDVEPAED